MNAKEFWQDFKRITDEAYSKGAESALFSAYNGSKNFTSNIMGVILDICSKHEYILKKKDTKIEKKIMQTEYYKIDLIGYSNYKEKATEMKSADLKDFVPSLWNLDFAIEHENNRNLWCDEAMKLAYICCPLRVVIGYVKIDKNKPDIREDEKYLNFVADLFNQLPDYAKNNLNSGEYMIILGNGKVRKGAYEQYFHYKAYCLGRNASGDFTFYPCSNCEKNVIEN